MYSDYGIVHRGKPRGWVADYCPICRDVQPHRLLLFLDKEMRTMPPVAECEECEFRQISEAERYFRIAAKKPDSLRDLIDSTFPRLPLLASSRVAWERRAIAGQIGPPERRAILQEPLLAVGYLRFASPGIIAGLVILAIVFLPIFLAMGGVYDYWMRSSGPAERSPYPVVIGAAIALVIATQISISLLSAFQRSFARKHALPKIARSLRPLRPSLEEIHEILDWARAVDVPIARCIEEASLRRAIAEQPDRSFTHYDELRLDDAAKSMLAEMPHANAEYPKDDPPAT